MRESIAYCVIDHYPMILDVALVTYSDLPGLAEDEQLVVEALGRRGLRAGPVMWDDPQVDWAGVGITVIRSTWDYHHRLDEFLAWTERITSVTALWNSSDVVRWNTRKTYLRDLAERGITIVPTLWLECGARTNLADLIAGQGWRSAVVKPVVSASAYGTVLVTQETLDEGQTHIDRLLAERDMMMQPFMSSVETDGEHSLMFIDGKFTHSVRRVPAIGQDRQGYEKAVLIEPYDDAINFARRVLRAASFVTLYARVDLVRDEEGALRLMELELVEPSLFLMEAPDAAEKLADAIRDRLARA